MLRNAFRDAARHPTSLVFLVCVLAGLVMGYARADPPLASSELALLLILSLMYLVVGTVVFIAVLGSGSPANKIWYLVFQISLGMLILYLERGNGWLIMLPLASHSVALFAPKLAVIPCVIITLGIAWNTSRLLPNWVPFMQSAVVFGAAVTFAAVFTNISIRDARRREEVECLAAELEKANREMQAYAAQVEQLSVTQERNRVAREIHDGLGHYLTAMNLQAQVVSTLIEQDAGQAKVALAKMQAMILEALVDVRHSVAALRGQPSLGKGLLEALQPLIDETYRSGVEVELVVTGEIRSLSPGTELTLYRAVQEGLTNAQKHARAEKLSVGLDYQPGQVGLTIQDDGTGSTLEMRQLDSLSSSFGLFGLRERVQMAGGSMAIQTAPGQGFRLQIILPTGEAL